MRSALPKEGIPSLYSALLPLILTASFLILSTNSAKAALIKTSYFGDSIPKFISTESRIIFSNSDSLYLNGNLLVSNNDYFHNRTQGGFDLSKLSFSSNDTLVVTYRTAPIWLAQSFGQPIPEIGQSIVPSQPVRLPIAPSRLQSASLSDINISGAKTFRFTTQTAGTSDFGQSLDLNVDGKLATNLKISGAISDRGFNPSYGTSNSRLEELDKVNLRLESRNFTAQVGDIQLGKRLFQQNSLEKKISGASADITTPNFAFNGVAARPKGRFTAVDFNGTDGVQGPYQIGENGQPGAIVPSSEKVWLDGILLSRGAENDYTMDYPAGRITFSVRRLIDRRSRIEIDFEPISSAYETELLSTGGKYAAGDSSFYAAIEWYREGDVSDQPQNGEFSSADKLLLESAGDNSDLAVRSGVRADTSGSYIIDSSSLPDTVYKFTGDNSGDYNATFSYVGKQIGDYKFAGGDEYVYVGKNGGDYLPVVRLDLPERTEFYSSKFGLTNEILGSMQGEISVSQFDKNLFSSISDEDNQGLLINFDSRKPFYTNGNEGNLQLHLRMKEAEYDSRSRINTADFSRNYLTPAAFNQAADERLYEAKWELSPVKNLTFRPFYGRLDYRNKFSSDKFEIGSTIGDVKGLNGNLIWATTNAELTDSLTGQGKADSWLASISVPLIASTRITTEFEHDRRTNDYLATPSGLKYNRYSAGLERAGENITYEFYTEDSLNPNWSDLLERNRVSGSSDRRFGKINFNAYLGYQWFTRPNGREESFLGRTNVQFNDSRKQLSISGAYTLSEETRNARGLTYLEVEPGRGNFSYENGRYVPDPFGNFIQVEELLSDQSKVNRGEKSFQLSKNWKFAQLRFNSNIEEELLESGQREIWWLIPFLSDGGQPYLVYNRNYNSEVQLIPIKGGHAINLSFDERLEIRNVAGTPRNRRDRAGTIALKQAISRFFIEEKLKLFSSDRDNYFIGSGEIDGYQFGSSARTTFGFGEILFGAAFRQAKSATQEKSETISINGEARFRVIEKGELRNSIELYNQNLQGTNGVPSYQLTDNKLGTKGITWTSGFNYSVRKGMRINFNLSGRHSNESTARLFGRTEVVAEF